MQCPICNYTPKDPVKFDGCRNEKCKDVFVYCKNCIRDGFQSGDLQKCVSCRQPFRVSFPPTMFVSALDESIHIFFKIKLLTYHMQSELIFPHLWAALQGYLT